MYSESGCHDSASHEASDGCFAGGVLTGKTVNVKYKSKNDYLLNMKPESTPDYYLVFDGSADRPFVVSWHQCTLGSSISTLF